LSPTGRPKADPAPRKILLLRLRRLGDVVLTTPAITLLKTAFPQASLTYLVEEPFRRLVEGNPHLDRVLAVPAKQGTADLLRLIRAIRAERYDAVLDFHGGPRASWITLLGGAKLKIGYAIKSKGFLYDVRVPRSGADGPVHSVENHANLVRAFFTYAGAHSSAEIPPLLLPEPTPAEKDRVAALLAQAAPAIAPGSRLVALHIGAGNRFRDWGADNLAGLLSRLADVPGVRIALLGAEGDRETQARLLAVRPEAVVPLAGRLGLMEVRETIRRAALFAGPDSGPMHIAASTPTPIVAWFGPTLPAHFAPWRPSGGRTVILERALSCRPCDQRTCLTGDYRCLRTLTPDEVFQACRPFLV
jgi:ADP-heptose:LPS heptosyltransferase